MLIGFQNVTFEFGARVIVEDATWHIQPGDRIGLIGYNGTGKSTLLKVLVGEYTPSKGTVEKSRETTIGYLHQDLLSFDTNDNITEVALSAFERVRELEKEIPGLRLVEAAPAYKPEDAARMTWASRPFIYLWNVVPALRKTGRMLRFRF